MSNPESAKALSEFVFSVLPDVTQKTMALPGASSSAEAMNMADLSYSVVHDDAGSELTHCGKGSRLLRLDKRWLHHDNRFFDYQNI